jgi:precorrin-3B synthase
MIARAHLRKGWCPGALRPMESGDGLLLRVRPRLGTLPLSALTTIAQAAVEFGSGEIDLTNRGNLQLRGLHAGSYPQALAALDAAGLIDVDAGIEAVRNIVVDPLSGIDPARADVRPLAGQLEDVLARNRTFRSLPGKFGFSFSGSAERQVGGRSADIMVSVHAPETFTVSLDGTTEIGTLVSTSRVVEAMTRLAAVFLELRVSDPAIARMRDAVVRRGSVTIFAAAGFESRDIVDAEYDNSPPPVGPLIHAGRAFAFGVGLPFGRIEASQLEAIAGVASETARASVRTSPQRVLVFPVEREADADSIAREAKRQGLITEPADLRLLFDVCPGAPACPNATTDTRHDARRIAEAVQGRPLPSSLHISGCEKGCARRGIAALTLVARSGHYDLIANGGPDGPVSLSSIRPAEIDAAVARFIVEQAS